MKTTLLFSTITVLGFLGMCSAYTAEPVDEACPADSYVPSGFQSIPKFKIVPRCAWKNQLEGSPVRTFVAKVLNKHEIPVAALVVHHSAIPVVMDTPATRLEPSDNNSQSASVYFKNVPAVDLASLSTYQICVRQLHYFTYLHTQTKAFGFDDLAYNYLICPDGTIFEGRIGGRQPESQAPDGTTIPAQVVLGKDVRGSHVSKQNNGTVGINLMGQFSSDAHVVDERGGPSEVTPLQKQALVNLVAWLAKEYDLGLDRHVANPEASLSNFRILNKDCEEEMAQCLVWKEGRHTCKAEVLNRCQVRLDSPAFGFKTLQAAKSFVGLMSQRKMYPLTHHLFMGLHRKSEEGHLMPYYTECPGDLQETAFLEQVRLEAIQEGALF